MNVGQSDSPLSESAIEQADELYQRGLCDRAVDLLLETIKHHSADKLLYFCAAEMLIDSEQYQDALDILIKMPSVDESGRLRTAEGRHRETDISLGVEKQNPELRQSELMGYCKIGLGKYHEANRWADRVLCIWTDSASALNLKGLAAYKEGDKKTAEICYQKAISLDPGLGEPYTNLGTLKWESTRYGEALSLFERGFNLAPTRMHIVLTYHSAITAQKAFAGAESHFRKANTLYPQNKRLKYLLIDILIQQSKHEAAMQEIEAAMASFGIDDGILPAALKIRGRVGPLEIDHQSKNEGTVSLCMIAKNEEKYLAQCLRSVRPMVDEMIVVDTGSTDRTKDVARAFGAKLYDFTWEQDFSEARNVSLSKAAGDWIFILDADEVIAPDDYSRFKALVKTTPNGSAAFSIETRNYTMLANTIGWTANSGEYAAQERGTGWFPSVKIRLFPNFKNIRFEYPVHEMVEPCLKKTGIELKACDIPVHHYGKLSEKKQNEKGKIYFRIGLKKHDEIGNNPAALRELAVQAGNLEKWKEAIELWQRFLILQPESAEAFINIGTAYWQLAEYREARLYAEKAIALQPELKEAHFNCAINLLHLGCAEKAIPVLQNLLECHPQYLAARFMLAAAYSCAGMQDKAQAGFRKIKRTNLGSVLAITFCDLAKRFLMDGRIRYAESIIQAAKEINSINPELLSLLDEYR